MSKLCVTLCALWCILAGCERREITYYLESELDIRADWSTSSLEDREESFGATTVFFPVEIALPTGSTDARQILMGTRDEEKVRLPEGTYHAIIFNRSPDGFTTLRFTGDCFERYTATAREVETRTDPETRQTTRIIITSPEELAADVVESVHVSETMLGNYAPEAMARNRAAGSRAEEQDLAKYIVRFTPRKLTRKVKVDIHMEGINNIRNVVGTIDGVSESIALCTGQPSATTASQQFELPMITYDEGSPFNGTLSGTFNVLGFDIASERTIKLKMLLVDNKTVINQTLQAKAEVKDDGNGEIVIVIHIASPERLPDVKPEGDPDSGFDANVDEWGDPEEEEIPL